MAANNPTIGTGLWTLVSGSGNVVNPVSPGSPVNSLGLGTNVFQWMISNGVCPPSASTVAITSFTNPSAASTGASQTVCATTATITANTPSIGNGYWTLLSGGGIPSTPANPTTAVTSLGVGTNIFQWTISNGPCPVSTATVAVFRFDFPSVANAGPSQTICITNSTLNAVQPAVGTGSWTVLAGGGVVSNPFTHTTSVSSMTIGTNIFMWTVSNGICPPNTGTTEIIVITDVSPVSAGPDLQLCGLTGNMNALTPGVGTGTWTPIGSAPNVVSVNNPTTAVSFTAYGTYSYQWTVGYLSCPLKSDTVEVTLWEPPDAAITSPDHTLCVSTTTISANTPSVGTGIWQLVGGNGNIVNQTSTITAVNGMSVGVNAFEWVISNGVCPPSRDTVFVQIDDHPSNPVAGPDQTICVSTTTLNADIPILGNGLWTTLVGGGVVTTPTLNNSSVINLTVGVNAFEWMVYNGVCPPKYDTVRVFVDALPTPAIAGADQHTCELQATLNGNTLTIGTGTWFPLAPAPPVTNPGSPNSSVSFTNQGIYSYVWTTGNGVCPNSTDTVTIYSYLSPSNPNAGPNQVLCALTTTIDAQVPAIGTGTWYPISGGVLTNPLNPLTAVTFTNQGTYGFVWEVSNSPYCVPKRDTVFVTTYLNPTPANAGLDFITDCFKGELFGNTPLIGSGHWKLLSGEGSFENALSPNTFFTSEKDGVALLSWNIANGVCPVSSDTLEIRINPILIPQVITPNEDGNNDSFEIKAFDCLSGVKLAVFNRWGNLVYETNDYRNDFKGRGSSGEILIDDTYYYAIEVGKKIYKGYFIIKTQ